MSRESIDLLLRGDPPVGRSPHKVVVIDDDPNYRRYLERYLTQKGCRVIATDSGREVLELCARVRPHIVVLDWGLAHGPTGEQTVRSLKSNADTMSIPVLAISGVVDEEDRQAILAAGADDFFEKLDILDGASLGFIGRLDELAVRGARPRGARVLVVDGDTEFGSFSAATLSAKHYDVHRACSGPDALSLAQALRPSLILLDFHISGLDGIQVYRLLRAEERTRSIPVIATTACSDDLFRSVALALGAEGFLHKPFGENELLVQVSRLLAKAVIPALDDIRIIERGRVRVDLDSGRVWVLGRLREIGPQRFELLRVLCAHPKGVEREAVLREAWNGAADFNLLAKTIQRLKQDLGLKDAIVFRAGSYRLVG